jgi:hypothetical protein
MPSESEFICGDWIWDPVSLELSHYARRRKGHAESPDSVERLPEVRSVTLHTWSQQPMQAQTGGAPASGRLARIEVSYEDGRRLEINESDRECAARLADAIAVSFGLDVIREGAPGGRRSGNAPLRDGARLRLEGRRIDVLLDESTGEIHVTRRKALGRRQRQTYRTSDVRYVELRYEVNGAMESFTVAAVIGPLEERIPFACYSGYEGWADPHEWREFGAELARSLGVEFVVTD